MVAIARRIFTEMGVLWIDGTCIFAEFPRHNNGWHVQWIENSSLDYSRFIAQTLDIANLVTALKFVHKQFKFREPRHLLRSYHWYFEPFLLVPSYHDYVPGEVVLDSERESALEGVVFTRGTGTWGEEVRPAESSGAAVLCCQRGHARQPSLHWKCY